MTSGGIDYEHAVVACDKAAREQLFSGHEDNSDPILGRQQGMVGLSEDQYLASYNVRVDGNLTAITCLVDGTKDEVHVISVNQVDAQ
ncbi:hypothetical protein JS530_10695 [Bifidobacterium sp. LC6]|uniref:Uncharacterized protein n=1 Tax=Bifidobacterium colobi TaxID=2809026 RepID=A0ABS5UXW9_9BIFI|nr:hypothetical protein [Bifidobacterium colobi]